MAQTYRVTAPSKVFGVDPGDTFERDIPEAQEARLLGSGAIEKVSAAAPVADQRHDAEVKAQAAISAQINPSASPWANPYKE